MILLEIMLLSVRGNCSGSARRWCTLDPCTGRGDYNHNNRSYMICIKKDMPTDHQEQ